MENIKILVPLDDITECVAVMSDYDLKKQRRNIRRTLLFLAGKLELQDPDKVRMMWEGHEEFLKYYFNTSRVFMSQRGYIVGPPMKGQDDLAHIDTPSWWGDDRVHRNHRLILFQDDHDFYCKYKWEGQLDVDKEKRYYWPVTENI